MEVQIVGLSRFGRLLNYQQMGSKFLILMTIVIIISIIIILSCVMHPGQHPQKVALGFKTAFCDSQLSWLSLVHFILEQKFGTQTIANAVVTQTARRVNNSFI